eukprot:12687058-Alexandrium_andersonii.AAC.1
MGKGAFSRQSKAALYAVCNVVSLLRLRSDWLAGVRRVRQARKASLVLPAAVIAFLARPRVRSDPTQFAEIM